MSAQTLEFHHDKHHSTYVTTLNKLIENTELAEHSLESIIGFTYNDPSKATIFNNAAQVWNHTFFWNSMKPGGGQHPTGALAEKITADFGSFDQFKETFKSTGVTQFGSGYTWLVLENNMLKVVKTANDTVGEFIREKSRCTDSHKIRVTVHGLTEVHYVHAAPTYSSRSRRHRRSCMSRLSERQPLPPDP
jgi:superoxide dismutase